jgi:hypothetical protein
MAVRGFSEIARKLTEHYGLPEDKAVSRMQVYQWWERETRNADGQPFPRELRVDPDASTNRPNRDFDLDAVIAWADAGVPDMFGDGWRWLGRPADEE